MYFIIQTGSLIWLTILLSAIFFPDAKAADERPNLVVIVVDDLNDLPLDPGGKPAIVTPNIDRLARRGISFTNAHTNNPLCAPARASLLFWPLPSDQWALLVRELEAKRNFEQMCVAESTPPKQRLFRIWDGQDLSRTTG